jgi:hypothetical protein
MMPLSNCRAEWNLTCQINSKFRISLNLWKSLIRYMYKRICNFVIIDLSSHLFDSFSFLIFHCRGEKIVLVTSFIAT